jgi:hypothetical protein
MTSKTNFKLKNKARRLKLAKLALLGLAQNVVENIRLPLFSDYHAGKKYIYELLNYNNEARIYRVLRMKLDTFYRLWDWLKEKAGIKSSRKNITVEEKLFIFLWTVNTGASNRDSGAIFTWSKYC